MAFSSLKVTITSGIATPKRLHCPSNVKSFIASKLISKIFSLAVPEIIKNESLFC